MTGGERAVSALALVATGCHGAEMSELVDILLSEHFRFSLLLSLASNTPFHAYFETFLSCALSKRAFQLSVAWLLNRAQKPLNGQPIENNEGIFENVLVEIEPTANISLLYRSRQGNKDIRATIH